MTSQVVKQMGRYKEKMGTKAWDYKIAAKDLPCQIGSLTKMLMQLEGERYRHGKSDQQIRDGISDELADLLSLVLFIAHELKIDIHQAWQGMLMSDEEKFCNRAESSTQ
jgi:NTP pyrophosphatase (non-canonical NTP hydrolase)